MKTLFFAIISYLIGCINPAYLIGQKKGYDIRERGSLNAGASNVLINVGKRAGAFTALFDIFKSFFCYKMAETLIPEFTFAGILCASVCVFGHIFPVFLKFRGGKGFASLCGLILGFNLKAALLMAACAVVILLVTDYLCLVTTFASASIPIIYYCVTKDPIGATIVSFVGMIIISKHFCNFKRIKKGTEARFSGIWNREKEEERIRQNLQK